MDRSWRMPNLSRDLAMVGGAIVLGAALIGGAIGAAVDVLVKRHRDRA